jgi:hypothetical protein
MTSRPRLRLLLVAVAAAACDTGITPPADTPVLALSAREVAMFAPKGSTIPDTALVYVFNNGRGTLAGLTLTPPVYQDSATGWLSATLQDTTIILAASAEHLPLQTTYTATLGVVLAAADSSPRTITVMFEVGQTQQIALSDTSLAFGAILGGALPPPQTITVTNGGTGVLNELRDPTVTANWLSATLGSATAPAHVDVVPSAIPGLPGTYQALVVVSSRVAEPQSDTVQVTYVVAEPATLELAADTLALDAVEGAAPVVRHVRVREARLRPLDGLAVSAPTRGWLAASLVADSAPTALVITADPGALYTAADTARMVRDTARVTVTSGGGGSQTLLVTLQVRRGPTVRVSPNVVTLTMYRSGPAPPPQVVSVTNDGQGTLTGLDTVPGLPPWLTASFDTRTAPAALTLQVDSTGLAAGNYAGSVIVRSDAARWDTVNVRFTVRGGPSLAISSDAVTFRADSSGAVPHAVELLAGNAGPGVLRGWSISLAAPAPWLNWVLDSTQVPARLTLRPNVTTGLRRDTTYDATLSIAAATAGAASQTIAIRYALSDTLPTDSIWISPDSVSLVAPLDGSDLPSAVLGVTYAGPGRPAVASYPTWLTATRVEGDSGLVLGLSAIPSGSLPGTVLTGTVVISDPRSSADTVAVRLTIVGPAAALSADTVRFRAYQGQSPWPAAQRLLVANGCGHPEAATHRRDGAAVARRDAPGNHGPHDPQPAAAAALRGAGELHVRGGRLLAARRGGEGHRARRLRRRSRPHHRRVTRSATARGGLRGGSAGRRHRGGAERGERRAGDLAATRPGPALAQRARGQQRQPTDGARRSRPRRSHSRDPDRHRGAALDPVAGRPRHTPGELRDGGPADHHPVADGARLPRARRRSRPGRHAGDHRVRPRGPPDRQPRRESQR